MSLPWPIPAVAVAPIAIGTVVWRMGGVPRVTVLVKATFGFVHHGAARLLPPRELLREDQGHDGMVDEAAETAPFLPSAGVVLTGHAHAPGGRPAPSVAVRLAVYRERPLLDKTLHVFGPRAAGTGAPSPFQKLPLGWDRAAGGPGHEDNPAGVAAQPSILDPLAAQRPAGFGPIAAHWGPRRRLLGLEAPRAAPGGSEIPGGIDFRFFHAAPEDQQIGYLHGDEWIVLDGLDPALPRTRTRLPGARAEARWHAPRGRPRPVELHADTLVIDADRRVCSMIWRGCFVLEDAPERLRIEAGLALPEAAPIEIPAVAPIVVATPPTLAARAPEPLEKSLLDERNPLTLQVMISHAQRPALPFTAALPFTPSPPPAAPSPSPLMETLVDDGTAADALRKVNALLAPFAVAEPGSRAPTTAAPLPGAPWSVPAATRPHVEESTTDARTLTDASEPQDAQPLAPPAPVRERAIDALDDLADGWGSEPLEAPPGEPSQPAPAGDEEGKPAAPPPAPTEGETEKVRSPLRDKVIAAIAAREALRGIDLQGADLRGIDFSRATLSGCKLAGADLRGCVLIEARLGDADLTGADLTDAVLDGADLVRARFSRATLGGASFAGALLSDADFGSARGARASFAGASGARTIFARGIWDGASFERLEVTGADFTAASLAGARFDGATMIELRLDDAQGAGASFDGARMPGAHAETSAFARASFKGAEAPRSVWERATLDEAVFAEANLEGAEFARAACPRASFVGARAAGINLARLTGDGADLRRAVLTGAELRGARLPEASFEGADLRGIQAQKADLSRARLDSADLTGANLRSAKLAGASLVGAVLQSADLRDADLERADLTGASRRTAKLNGANLKDLVGGGEG